MTNTYETRRDAVISSVGKIWTRDVDGTYYDDDQLMKSVRDAVAQAYMPGITGEMWQIEALRLLGVRPIEALRLLADEVRP